LANTPVLMATERITPALLSLGAHFLDEAFYNRHDKKCLASICHSD